MNRDRVLIGGRGLLFAAWAVMPCSSCGTGSTSNSQARLPDSALARRAIETSLEKWHDSPDLAATSKPSSSIVFVDQQRRPGRRLLAFAVLGETEVEGCRRFLVKLSLAEPDESLLAAYYVFGQDPTWVYRREDLDMIMHWEHLMPADPPAPAAVPTPENTPKTKAELHDHAPGTGATFQKTG